MEDEPDRRAGTALKTVGAGNRLGIESTLPPPIILNMSKFIQAFMQGFMHGYRSSNYLTEFFAPIKWLGRVIKMPFTKG